MGVRVGIRVRPGASRTNVGGRHGESLVIRVAAPPIEGRATEQALRALADALGVRRAAVSLVSGAASRDKVVEIQGDPQILGRLLSALRDQVEP
jgi:uncharacterized protein (TIGR00251 family)